MSINDVDYLKKNSIVQSYAFLVNSADRNMTIYSSPSEYTIPLSIPFQNVIKFEVQDASIPRTMYNIDIYNNIIGFFIYDQNFFNNVNTNYNSSSKDINFNEYFYNQCQLNMNYVSIDPADYDIYSFLNVINSSLEMNLNNDKDNVLVKIITETVSSPPELKSQLRFRCPYSFVFDMYNSTISENLGFNSLVNSYELQKSIDLKRETYYDYSYNSGLDLNNKAFYQHFYSLYSTIPTQYAKNQTSFQYVLYDGSSSISNPVIISKNNYIAQYFNISSEINGPGYILNLGVEFGIPEGGTDGIGTEVNWYIFNNIDNQPYNFFDDNNNIYNELFNGTITVTAVDGTYSYINISPSGDPLQPGDYWLVLGFPSDSTSSIGVYTTSVNNISTNPFQNNTSLISDNTNTWKPYTHSDMNQYYCISITFQSTYNVIISPGIYSFVGEKYVIVRCPEIEDHCFRSLMALEKHYLGLAKFRLGVVGYTENALVYNTIPAREFHPIGKLTQLSFRFETANRNLYDFKGCNHNITFIIYYYEGRPNSISPWDNSILNPNYNPNIIEYLYKEEDRDDESDEEDEDNINFSRDNKIENYKAIENRNLPENMQKIDLNAMYNITRSNKLS